jgi:predicted DNA binding CopG/RHH family protein
MKNRRTGEENREEENEHPSPTKGGERRKCVERKAGRARKNHAISLRLSEFDLEMVKQRADREGLPYQTLINRIIHKYVTDQLYEKDEVTKILGILKEKPDNHAPE